MSLEEIDETLNALYYFYLCLQDKIIASSVDVTYLTDLEPDTTYDVQIFTTYDTLYGVKYSPNTAQSSFTTKQKSKYNRYNHDYGVKFIFITDKIEFIDEIFTAIKSSIVGCVCIMKAVNLSQELFSEKDNVASIIFNLDADMHKGW